MKLLGVAILMLFLNGLCLCQQAVDTDSIKLISFDFQQTRQLYHHNLHVNIKLFSSTSEMHIKSTPACGDKKCLKSAIDTIYQSTIKEFVEIRNAVLKISSIHMKDAQVSGFDGVNCSVGFGDGKTWIWYQVWSPNTATKERGLEEYVDACKFIIRKAKLRYRQIL